MLKSELIKLIEEIGDDQDINETILGIEDFAKASKFDVNNITVEDFKQVITDNNTIKGYYQSTLDSAVSKGVESFKTKKMPTYIDDAIKAKSNEGKTPEQIKLEELQQEIATMKAQKQRAELSSKYTKTLTDKNLPTDLIDFILSDNEEVIDTNISKFEGMMKSYVDTEVNNRMKGSYKPPTNNNQNLGGKITWNDVVENPSLITEYNKQSN